MSVLGEPENEAHRLAALRRYEVLDSPPEPSFDRIMRLVARVFDVPIAAVSLVDEARIWFKARYGLDPDSVEREPGLCASGILQEDPWIVLDARADDRTAAHSLVAGPAGIRFYAGAPLRTFDGFNIGMVCIADRHPRRFTAADADALVDVASMVMDELELRALRHPDAADAPHEDSGISWEPPPSLKTRTVVDWNTTLAAVAERPNVWAKIAHYSGETSAYRAASQLRSRDALPAGDWEFAARRAGEGSDLFARVTPED